MRIDTERNPKSDKVTLTVVADNLSDSGPGRLADALRAGGANDIADDWSKQIVTLAKPPPKPKKGSKTKPKPREAKLELTDAGEIRLFGDCIRNVWPGPTREINDALSGIA